jgi:peptidoglycan/xylan/chitin deacetylase (PgdA/CDA1 family)
LDLLDQYAAKATFFITGNNNGKGEIDNAANPWANIIKRMDTAGHQIASHTWTHQDLSVVTAAQRLAQMYNNEIAFNNILGKFPTYMRPPYSSCTAACQTALATLGYHIIYFDLDSEDYLHDDPTQIQISKNDFSGNLSTSTAAQRSWLEISHDIHQQTAYNLTEYMLITLKAQGYTAVTVGDCLGDPKANWYRTLGGGSVFTSGSVVQVATSSVAASSLKASSTVASSVKSSSVSVKASSTSSVKASSVANASSVKPASSVVSSAAPVASSKVISTDATCGGAGGFTCQGSTFGNCCSTSGCKFSI